MSKASKVASIRQRLLNIAQSSGEAFEFILSRYAIERLLYRLSRSEHADRFILKGAMLFYLWNEHMHRPTRDVDFLGYGPSDRETVRTTFSEIAGADAPEDGLDFDLASVEADSTREDAVYDGIRVRLLSRLGNIRIPLQIDVGFGDAITPSPVLLPLPGLLPELPVPTLKTYPVYTVIAEKLEAMVHLGEFNSRMKDFFDIHFLATNEALDKDTLAQAIRATFSRRQTPLPKQLPDSLRPDFAALKQTQWGAFLKRNNLKSSPENFDLVLREIRETLSVDWIRLADQPPSET